jgi:hypothetical protein
MLFGHYVDKDQTNIASPHVNIIFTGRSFINYSFGRNALRTNLKVKEISSSKTPVTYYTALCLYELHVNMANINISYR